MLVDICIEIVSESSEVALGPKYPPPVTHRVYGSNPQVDHACCENKSEEPVVVLLLWDKISDITG